ncbi:MAG: glutathione peroxidase, partial [Atopobiaceae bacterium]|nr:glutathione peroxidase [Atopobiaceae bacterium]
MAVYDYVAVKPDGTEVPLSDYAGKVLLIVNTATGCGFTPQYEELEAIYAKYRDQGFEILDFPCNQFANQAPESDEEIHQFCTLKFGTEFPQFKKGDVNGESANPLFVELATTKPFQGFDGLKKVVMNRVAKSVDKEFGDKAYIKWNFTKFLIDRDGSVVARFEPTDDMAAVEKAVGIPGSYLVYDGRLRPVHRIAVLAGIDAPAVPDDQDGRLRIS